MYFFLNALKAYQNNYDSSYGWGQSCYQNLPLVYFLLKTEPSSIPYWVVILCYSPSSSGWVVILLFFIYCCTRASALWDQVPPSLFESIPHSPMFGFLNFLKASSICPSHILQVSYLFFCSFFRNRFLTGVYLSPCWFMLRLSGVSAVGCLFGSIDPCFFLRACCCCLCCFIVLFQFVCSKIKKNKSQKDYNYTWWGVDDVKGADDNSWEGGGDVMWRRLRTLMWRGCVW